MYRDDLEAYRARLEVAQSEVAAAWAGVRRKLELLAVLRQQLREVGQAAPEIPGVEPPTSMVEPAPDVEAVDLVRLAGDAEKEARRLRESEAALGRLAELLNRRAQGEEVTLPLGDPPRRVPALYGIAELASIWVLIAMAVGLGLSWSAQPSDGATGLVPLLLPGIAILVGAVPSWFRMRFLARCRQATAAKVIESGSDGSSMTNWPVRRSRGWDVVVESYTGSGTRDVVEFLTHDGRAATLVVKGAGYDGGVILYDPATLRARDVKQLHTCPRPDAEGRWAATLGFRSWIRVALLVVLVGVWVYSTVQILGAHL